MSRDQMSLAPLEDSRRWISANDVSIGHGGRAVLEGLHFDLSISSTAALIGPGGSGKSSLLRVLMGQAGAGTSLWYRGDLRLPELPPCALPQRKVSSEESLLTALSRQTCDPESCPCARRCCRLVRDGGDETGHRDRLAESVREIWHAAPAAAESLLATWEQTMSSLEGGLGRLAELTRRLVAGAPYLLLDEPDSDLDELRRRWVTALLGSLRSRRTIVLVSRHLGFVREVADVCILLADGGIVEMADVSSFFERPSRARTRHFIRMGC